ncbi:hypothetical protein [Pannonibacter phragmitetus]|uniref:hypothetical protein n=1 Tax=Pannonibacter phragmitetus TaxID=121719 RepID=UPI0013C3EA16|nr:hypothetical protein [Pannonibacter phragmitetus]
MRGRQVPKMVMSERLENGMFVRTQADTGAVSAERELKIIDGIKQSIGDAASGRVVPHEQAMAELYAVIGEAEEK